jgi:hypothetical protein
MCIRDSYDLKRDPGETKDLAASEPSVVTRLTKAVLAWHRSMPPDRGPELGAKAAAKGTK